MTNFERWKAGLKPEDMVVKNRMASYPESLGPFGEHEAECGQCPAKKYCEGERNDKSCGKRFLEWANADVKSNSRMKEHIKKCKDKITDEELRLFVYLSSNVVVLIAVTLICAFFGVEPENSFGAAVIASVIFSLIFSEASAKEEK